MQIIGPLSKFYFKHSADLEAVEAEDHGHANLPVVLDFITRFGAPFIKYYFTWLNRNGMVDDFVVMLKEMVATAPTIPSAPNVGV
jgi:hypothetical protein